MKTRLPYFILIAVLIAIVVLQRECTNRPAASGKPKADTVKIVDTVYVNKLIEVKSKPKPKASIPGTIPDTFKPKDTTYAELKKKYDQLVNAHSRLNIYEDSLILHDSLGYITIIDTVQYNLIKNRRAIASVNIPKVIETVTIREYEKPVRQMYIGGGLSGSKSLTGITADLGMLYKTKKDHLYGVSTGINTSGQIIYGFHTYWKISLKKK
jgi:hypothetical protein